MNILERVFKKKDNRLKCPCCKKVLEKGDIEVVIDKISICKRGVIEQTSYICKSCKGNISSKTE